MSSTPTIRRDDGGVTVPRGYRRKARLTVAAAADDPDDARYLLDALGILDDTVPEEGELR